MTAQRSPPPDFWRAHPREILVPLAEHGSWTRWRQARKRAWRRMIAAVAVVLVALIGLALGCEGQALWLRTDYFTF